MAAQFDELMRLETAADADGATGVGLLAVSRTGNFPKCDFDIMSACSKEDLGAPYMLNCYGRRTTISDETVDEQSAFWIYSITKTLTAISMLQCVQRREISLDDEVYLHLPELKQLPIVSLGEGGQMSFTPHTKGITVRHLLSHTSGIGMDLFDPRLQAWRMSREEIPRALCGKSKEAYTTPLLFEPGEGWAYGGGAEWAGILVERLTELKLEETMKKYIFDPLGMNSSTFHPAKVRILRGV